MKGLENQAYLIAWIISNIVALLILLTAIKFPRLARLLFFFLFVWASWINWKTALYSPEDYQDYAGLTFLPFYKQIIQGWFQQHTLLAVGTIASCQGLIAISMWMKGWVLKAGIIGAIVFLLAIVPLGVGAGMPATIVMTAAMFFILFSKANNYLWIKADY